MDAADYLATMRRYWRAIVVTTLVGGILATALGFATRQQAVAQYSATATAVLLTPQARATIEIQLLQEQQFVATTSLLVPLDAKGASRAATLTQILQSDRVLTPVAQVLGGTIEDVRARLSVTVPLGSEVLEIKTAGPDEAAARAFNAAITGELTSQLAAIDPNAVAPAALGTTVAIPTLAADAQPEKLQTERARLARALIMVDPTAAQTIVTPVVASFYELLAAELATDLKLTTSSSDLLEALVITAGVGVADPATGLIPNTGEITISVTAKGAADASALAKGAATILAERANTAAGADLNTPSPLVITSISGSAVIASTGNGDRTWTNLILGLLIGFAFGVGYAFYRASRDHTIRNPHQLFTVTDTPPIGVITVQQSDANSPWAALNTSGPEGDGYRSLRSNLLFGSPDSHLLVVTSPTAGDGKLTLAVNLAIAFAQVGKRVAIVEADLRQPRLTAALGLDGAKGLAEVLDQQLPIDQALQSWPAGSTLDSGSITVLGAGSPAANPAELLSSERYAAVLIELRSSYDYVICLSGPILGATEAAVVAKQSDGALVVVRLTKTTTTHLAAAATALIQVQTPIAGLVITAVPAGEAKKWAVFPGSAPAEV